MPPYARNNMQFPWKQMRFVEGQGQAKHLDTLQIYTVELNWDTHKKVYTLQVFPIHITM